MSWKARGQRSEVAGIQNDIGSHQEGQVGRRGREKRDQCEYSSRIDLGCGGGTPEAQLKGQAQC